MLTAEGMAQEGVQRPWFLGIQGKYVSAAEERAGRTQDGNGEGTGLVLAAADGGSLAGGLGCRRRCAGGCGYSQSFKTRGKDAFPSPLLHHPATQFLCRAPRAGPMCFISSPKVRTSALSPVSRAWAGVTTRGWHLQWSWSDGTHRVRGWVQRQEGMKACSLLGTNLALGRAKSRF